MLAAFVFVPLKYIYPSKLTVLFRTTLVLSVGWLLTMAVCVDDPDRARGVMWIEASLAYPAYYIGLSLWIGGWHAPTGASMTKESRSSTADSDRLNPPSSSSQYTSVPAL